eukprot:scaffold2669_cov216-Pinguiococcus_pyrenoidosus.AAC.1
MSESSALSNGQICKPLLLSYAPLAVVKSRFRPRVHYASGPLLIPSSKVRARAAARQPRRRVRGVADPRR